jgi:hypothetical protein
MRFDGMRSLSDLLLNHKVPGVREAHIRHTIAEAVTTSLGVPVLPKQVKYKDNVVSLAVPPLLKSALLMHGEDIKSSLALNDILVTSIR